MSNIKYDGNGLARSRGTRHRRDFLRGSHLQVALSGNLPKRTPKVNACACASLAGGPHTVGGILISTLVSLYFIPALCAIQKGAIRP